MLQVGAGAAELSFRRGNLRLSTFQRSKGIFIGLLGNGFLLVQSRIPVGIPLGFSHVCFGILHVGFSLVVRRQVFASFDFIQLLPFVYNLAILEEDTRQVSAYFAVNL